MDRNPATNASAVPAPPSPPTSPATTPIAKNNAAISLNPQPNRSTPTTSAANATSTRVRTAPRRPSSVPAVGPGSVAGAIRVRAAYRTVPQIQTPTAAARKAIRNSDAESNGNCASCCAIPTWNGLIGLKAAPTAAAPRLIATATTGRRSEEHTSELQSPCNLVCRLLLEKKKKHGSITGKSNSRRAEQKL